MLIISGNYVASAEVYLGASRVPYRVSGLPGLSKYIYIYIFWMNEIKLVMLNT